MTWRWTFYIAISNRPLLGMNKHLKKKKNFNQSNIFFLSILVSFKISENITYLTFSKILKPFNYYDYC
jgi:hypothetical protein